MISNKCAHAYGKHLNDQLKLGGEITKENMIKIISNLEQYSELRLTVSKTLPSSLTDTTLNLPPGQPEIYLQAHMASVPTPSDHVVIDVDANLGNVNVPPPAAISNKPKSQAYPNSVKPGTRSSSSKSPNRARKDEFQNKSKQRVSSRSPNRVNRDRSRGRSKEKDSTRKGLHLLQQKWKYYSTTQQISK